MRSFFRKPFVYTAFFSTALTLLFLWTILLVFVIPRADAGSGYETGDRNQFTGTIDNNWGHNTPDDTDPVGDTTADPFETQPGVEYPIITDNLYADENIRIELTEMRRYKSNLYVADIRIKDPTYLKTALAQDKFGLNIKEKTSEMAERVGAILAVNGDFYGANESGYVIRNGVLYRETHRPSPDSGSDLAYFDDLAIMWDGTFVTFDEKDYSAREVLSKGAMHVLTFGPTLVLNGKIAVEEDTEVGLAYTETNPRCAIGYVEEGHYLIIVADGRCDESPGLKLWQLADVFRELGAKIAYNLDGGGSATMVFNGRLVNTPYTNWNKPSGERRVSDIVYIGY